LRARKGFFRRLPGAPHFIDPMDGDSGLNMQHHRFGRVFGVLALASR
jgi:hypothetical protein